MLKRRLAFWPRPAGAGMARLRHALVDSLLSKGIWDRQVLDVMRQTPRHLFMPPAVRSQAYRDKALPIGLSQTISQPYIVALMTQALRLAGWERVLEIGTGSGYQTAVLSQLAGTVYTIEIRRELSQQAQSRLDRMGRHNVLYRIGDGWQGWPEQDPFDAILVTAAPEQWPMALLEQLSMGGRLVIPVGDQVDTQTLWLCRKLGPDSWSQESLGPVVFVPMTGNATRRVATLTEEH